MEVSLQSFKKRFTYDPQKDLLGKGGFGEVYKAYDTEDHIFVALKISQGTTDDKYNLISEIKRFKKLNHPNIVKHIEAYEVNTGSSDIHGKPIAYHVGILEYADNGTLADLLKKGTPDYRLIEDLAKDIIEGLAYLHSKGIIHRDLKPTNILLFSEGEKLHAKITDFGIAKRTDATAASTQLVGTVEYMAPEFFNTGNITPAADVWSVGVMLLEALTGTHPFGKTTQGLSNEQIINNILNKDLSTATQNLRSPFKEIITRCLLRETNLRPQSATELKGILLQSGDAFGGKTQVIQRPEKKKQKPKNKFRKVITTLTIILLVVGIGIASYYALSWYKIESRELVPFCDSECYYGFKEAKTGLLVIPCKYDFVDSFYEGRAMVLQGELYGFVDKSGELIVNTKYDEVGKFSEGLAMVETTNKQGYIDKNGNEIIPPQYVYARNFENGVAIVSLVKTKGPVFDEHYVGVINKKGEEIIPVKYDHISLNEKQIVMCSDKKCKVFDYTGKEIFSSALINSSGNCSDGLCEFYSNGKSGFCDENGQEVIPAKFDEAEEFINGYSVVKVNGKKGIIDKTGKFVLQPKYDAIEEFSEGLAKVGIGNSDTNFICGFIDTSFRVVIPLKFNGSRNFSDGLCPVRKDKQIGFINKHGDVVIPLIYDDAREFTNGIAVVGKDGMTGVIDKKGNEVIPFTYEMISQFDSYGISFAKQNGSWMLIDKNGKQVSKLYDGMGYAANSLGLYEFKRNGKRGLVTRSGYEVINFVADNDFYFSGGKCEIISDNKVIGIINQCGRVIKQME